MRLKRPSGKLKHKQATTLQRRGLIFILAFAVVGGAILLIATHAASPFATLNADKGSLAGGALAIADNNASDGNSVKFGQGTVTTVNPPTRWTNVTSNLAGVDSLCGNLSMLSAVPNSNKVIAGVATDASPEGLYQTTNNGASWTRLGTGGGDTITNVPGTIVYNPTNPTTFWESGIYGAGAGSGVYKTTDGGNTFTHLGSTQHDDSVSVDVTDGKTLLAGGHETAQRIDLSLDSGATWTNVWPSLSSRIGGAFTSYVLVINANTFLVAAYQGYAGGTPGIYKTTNGQAGINATWTQVSTFGPNGPPLVASDGTIYWPFNNSLIKSSSPYQTWTQVGLNGGLQTNSGTGAGMAPAELPDKSLVAIGTSNTLIRSTDGGVSWNQFGSSWPPAADGRTPEDVIYSSGANAFFTSHWDCNQHVAPVPNDAIMMGQ